METKDWEKEFENELRNLFIVRRRGHPLSSRVTKSLLPNRESPQGFGVTYDARGSKPHETL